jgi:hypothetical protein
MAGQFGAGHDEWILIVVVVVVECLVVPIIVIIMGLEAMYCLNPEDGKLLQETNEPTVL